MKNLTKLSALLILASAISVSIAAPGDKKALTLTSADDAKGALAITSKDKQWAPYTVDEVIEASTQYGKSYFTADLVTAIDRKRIQEIIDILNSGNLGVYAVHNLGFPNPYPNQLPKNLTDDENENQKIKDFNQKLAFNQKVCIGSFIQKINSRHSNIARYTHLKDAAWKAAMARVPPFHKKIT